MAIVRHLLFHVPFEPAYAYWNRLAAYACVPPSQYAEIYGLRYSDIIMGKQTGALAVLTDTDPEVLAAGTPELLCDQLSEASDAHWRMPNGSRFKGSLWWPADRRYCIGCLLDEGLVERNPLSSRFRSGHRFWSDLRLFQACPVHGELQLTSCPACHRPGASGAPPRYCVCGFDLTLQERRILPTDRLRFDRYLLERLTGKAEAPALLAPLTWCAARYLCQQVGEQIAEPLSATGRHAERRSLWRNHGLELFEIWDQGPITFAAWRSSALRHVTIENWRAVGALLRRYNGGRPMWRLARFIDRGVERKTAA